ncbi:polyprenol monophosphomannose synthase [Ornithinimicrobium cerasi]|uniref:Dolichol-phosphate mannosyltransferase n=1 Tax=Ornithinimicrobium cerasi TaxID=2248773 RepID=A0A285VJZ0_9MICO|nr:polyprenol monophosphomannose synthase [Ornithinimicrobium cerasi]SOC54405.1 dolichol-phosphate mannosyltransferase [Ornithinimicrobium cerasi]
MTPPARAALERTCVCVPTYNEVGNLEMIVRRLRAAVPTADLLVLDDASPDGTGALADRLAAQDPQVTVLHRPGKEGLGPAYLAGFRWAWERGYDAVVQIDADGSHQPEQLPGLLAAAERADVVIGSRWVPGGSVHNWPAHRRALSVGANTYARYTLGIPVRDATAGFRVYRLEALASMDTHEVASQGYCFQVDLTLRALDRGLTVVEVPVAFVEREVGTSKMSDAIVREAAVRVGVWGLQRRGRQARERLASLRRSPRWHHLEETP